MVLAEKFRTPRLLLTRFVAQDARDFAAMHQDPGVAEALGGVRPAGDIDSLAQALAAQWNEHGYGWWALREPQTARFIGCGGLRRVTLAKAREIEVGFGLIPEFWNRGLATELARVAVAQGFVRLGTASLVGFTRPGNAASRRVLEKAGFVREREIEHAGMPHLLYRVTAQAWCAAPAAPPRAVARPVAPEQAVAV